MNTETDALGFHDTAPMELDRTPGWRHFSERGDVYEQHADRVADLVVRGQSAEATLAELAGSPGGGAAVQRVADPFAA